MTDTGSLFYVDRCIHASAMSIQEKCGSLNLLINASSILLILNVFQPGPWYRNNLNKAEESSCNACL
uniref:Uncharacterized protein n=1 Tax=Manihot esculenta TaxID=3983 RepID=A0A2C9VN79_MANES